MKLVLLPLMISAAYMGFEHREAAIDLYRLAYPDDPAKRDALDQCSRGVPNFNRLDTADRDNCYASFSYRVAAVSAASFSPSHVPADDVRRQEAYDGYRAAHDAATGHKRQANGTPVPAPAGRRDSHTQLGYLLAPSTK
jgi:hypothetical protein